MTAPAKPWRVYGNHLSHLAQDYRGQAAAYDAVKELTGFGHTATVEHYEDGQWRLYERIEPEPVADLESPLDEIKRGAQQVAREREREAGS